MVEESFIKPVLMVDTSDGKGEQVTEQNNNMFDKLKEQIEKDHLDPDSDTAKIQMKTAQAFQKVFAERRKDN